MIAGNRVLGLIPARGGSKRLPRKNIIPLAGKPLIAWTIEAALQSKYLDRVILSSDDDEIMQVAADYGCEVPFRRPVHLAQDDTPGIEPVLHALNELPGFEYVILLQPTSPLRTAADIDCALESCLNHRSESCVSVTRNVKPLEWIYALDESRLRPIVPAAANDCAQRPPVTYHLNGAVYVARVEVLLARRTFLSSDVVAYAMPSERSADVDTALDLQWCEFLLSHLNSGRV